MPISIDQQILTDELLRRMAGRAAAYDEENRFFHEDFADLRAVGDLAACGPREAKAGTYGVKVTFRPAGGRATTSTRKVTLQGKRGKKARKASAAIAGP